jgi:hypothetical protein
VDGFGECSHKESNLFLGLVSNVKWALIDAEGRRLVYMISFPKLLNFIKKKTEFFSKQNIVISPEYQTASYILGNVGLKIILELAS